MLTGRAESSVWLKSGIAFRNSVVPSALCGLRRFCCASRRFARDEFFSLITGEHCLADQVVGVAEKGDHLLARELGERLRPVGFWIRELRQDRGDRALVPWIRIEPGV